MNQSDTTELTAEAFLLCATPEKWLEHAVNNLDTVLIDHAHCEKKAASSAMQMIYRYEEKDELLHCMSRLAREELRHFEQVLAILKARNIQFTCLSPANYAAGLRRSLSGNEPQRLTDTLIVGAIIEARSCERFAALAPRLDDELKKFYQRLCAAEARHFHQYLRLAEQYSVGGIGQRLDHFLSVEADLITSTDSLFRFHSGIPLINKS